MPLISYTDAMKQGLINGNGDFISQAVPRLGGNSALSSSQSALNNQQQMAMNSNNNVAGTIATSYSNASPLALQQQQALNANNAGLSTFTGNVNQGANENMNTANGQSQATNPFKSNLKADLSLTK